MRGTFKFIQQRDAMQCGVAALAMLCSCLGRRVDVASLERVCHSGNQGVSLQGLIDAAKTLGIKAVGVRTTVGALCENVPAILHWNQNHFLLLLGVNKARTRFKIADPAKGVMNVSREEFERGWLSTRSGGEAKGIALLCEPTNEFYAAKREEDARRRSNGRKQPFRVLSRYMNEYKSHFAAIALTLVAASVLQLIFPFLTQAIVDLGIAHRDIPLIWLILLGEFLIVTGRTLTEFIRARLLLHISMRVNISLVSDFLIKLLRLPMSFFDTKLLGDLMQRMEDHRRVESFLTGQALSVLFSLISLAVFGVVLWVYDPLIFAVFMAGSAVYATWKAIFLRRRKVLDYERFEQQAANNNKTYQLLTSMQEIKLQDCERRRRWEWEDVQAGLFGVQMKSLRLDQTQQAGAIFITEVKNMIIIVLCATAVINAQISLGAMLAIQFIVGQINAPVETIIGLVYSMQDVRISLDRINEIHGRGDEDATDAAAPQTTACAGVPAIKFDKVDFRYEKHNPAKVIDSMSFEIPEGKVTAIVGASGSGKTTLIKLMLGFYEPDAGVVAVRGKDIRGLDKKALRRLCGAVMQEGVIFSDTIARNIATSDEEIDTARLEDAARAACLHDTVMRMPLRYNTNIGRDGIGLSQGQKQRVLIARAIYRDPQFIFLDEATNSLDAKNEREIVENLRDFYRNRTVVVVAHRLSTVCDADNIIVLEGGRIAEQGTHAGLAARRGMYYNLIKNQLELGL